MDSFKVYYEKENRKKFDGLEKGNYERKTRSRWEFAKTHIAENSCVLDAACGDGTLGKQLQEKQCQVYGIDISDLAVNKAKEAGIDAKFCDISSDSFPFEDNIFDCVTLLCCLEHIIDPVHALRESLRVTKPNGKIIVTLPNAVNVKNRIEFLFGKVPVDLLHIKPGEGMHIQFYNYKNEFENKVLTALKDSCSIESKKGDLKKLKQEHKWFMRTIYPLLIIIAPNLFGQYTHWVLVKK